MTYVDLRRCRRRIVKYRKFDRVQLRSALHSFIVSCACSYSRAQAQIF